MIVVNCGCFVADSDEALQINSSEGEGHCDLFYIYS